MDNYYIKDKTFEKILVWVSSKKRGTQGIYSKNPRELRVF